MSKYSLLLLALASAAHADPARPPIGVMLTGELRAPNAESIYVPPANSSPVVLRYLAPEGQPVKPGDVLVRIDPGASLSQRQALRAQIEQTQARVERELAELDVRAVDAELALADADAALAKAEIDAAIPATYLARIDFDRYQGELERSRREASLKHREWQAAGAVVVRRRQDAALEIAKLQADLRNAEAAIANAEQKASSAGVVVYGFSPLNGQRYGEGASAYPGNVVGEVIGGGALVARTYALEPDRQGLAVGQPLKLSFDALPQRTLTGRITSISGAPQAKAEWGRGRYFLVDIALPTKHKLPLLPGMSVRAEALPENAP